MSQGARDLLNRGIAAAKANEIDEARFYLDWVLRTDANRQQKAQAWLWLSEVSDVPSEKRNCLEEVLANDPANAVARRRLAILEGRLDPAEIIDPNRPPVASQQAASEPVQTQRFICQHCGGKLAFRPNGRSLSCEHCGFEQTFLAAMNEGAMVKEHDFVVALATAKGHTRPVGMHPFVCRGCGASFLVGSSALSANCVYCGSAHVLELPETRDLILPEGLIPFAVSQQEARRALHQWLVTKKLQEKAKVAPVRGFYLPIWTFDLFGEIRWQCQTRGEESAIFRVGGIPASVPHRSRRLVREEGSYLLYENDILVPASHKLPVDLITEQVKRFALSDMVPYNGAYLVDWPAEVYEIPVSDASLVARRKALEKEQHFIKNRVRASLGYVKDLRLNTSNVIVESFKLILLPVWVAHYRLKGTIYHVVINGQTGTVNAQEPPKWHRRLFRILFS